MAMYRCARIRITDLNPCLMCVLCGGYFIDATTVIECLHSFCRTCIVRYLESSKYCPICDVQVHKTRPLLNIRSDKTLQDLVYKLVPGLFEEEMRRRREFLAQHPEVKVKKLSLEERGLAQMTSVQTIQEENISLVLELAPNGLPALSEGRKRPSSHKRGDRRYLLCPCDVSVGHLKKFIRLKFNLPHNFQIDVYHPKSREAIADEFTLLDITIVFAWNRRKPLKLFYCIFEKPPAPKKRKASTVAQSSVSSKRPRLENSSSKPATDIVDTLPSLTENAVVNTNGVPPQKLPSVGACLGASEKKEGDLEERGVSDKLSEEVNGKEDDNGELKVRDAIPRAEPDLTWHVLDRAHARSDLAQPEDDFLSGSTDPTLRSLPDVQYRVESKENLRSNIVENLKAEMSGSSRSNSPKAVSRTASPKPNSFNNSRTSSPVQRSLGTPNAKTNSGRASPKVLKDNSYGTASPKVISGPNSRTASPKLTNGDSRASSPKLSSGDKASSPKLTNRDRGTESPKLTNRDSTASPKLNTGNSRTSSPKLTVSDNSRSSSPKVTTVENSRTGSPRLPNGRGRRTSSDSNSPKSVNGRSSRTDSPKLALERVRADSPLFAADRSRTASPKLSSGRNSRTASPKPASGPSSRTSSPKPASTRTNGSSSPKLPNDRRVSGPTVALVPVEQSITVDVNVGTATSSSSEASPGVTSPGAEDRANSVTMADLPDSLKDGPHVCNTVVFASHRLPELRPACIMSQFRGVGQGQTKGNVPGQGREIRVQTPTKNTSKTKVASSHSKVAAATKGKDKAKDKSKETLYCPI